MDIKQILKEATKDTLSEENLQKLEEAINNRAAEIAKKEYELKLESALAKQDAEYADKLEKFIEDIDNDHCEKLESIVEGLSQKHYDMLQTVIKKYKSDYVTECKTFKEQMVNKVDKFFDIVVEQEIPKKELQEAVENVRSKVLLEKIAEMIGIEKIKQKPLVKEGLMDAKKQIDTLTERVEKLEREKNKLITEQTDVRRRELLEEKTRGLPRVKKEYINKVLGKKPIEFIKENFDYTLKLFDAEETANVELIKEQATKKTKTISEKIDRKEPVIQEKKQTPRHADMYMEELRRI